MDLGNLKRLSVQAEKIYKFVIFLADDANIDTKHCQIWHSIANKHWSSLASAFMDKLPTVEYAYWWAEKLYLAFEKNLKNETEEDICYLFGGNFLDMDRKELLHMMLKDFVNGINQHKQDEYPRTFGSKFQIWLTMLCQAFEKIMDSCGSPLILGIKQHSWSSEQHLAQDSIGARIAPEQMKPLSSESISIVEKEQISFKCVVETVSDIRFKPIEPLGSILGFSTKSPEHFTRRFEKPCQAKTRIPPGLETHSEKARAFYVFTLVIQAIQEIQRKQLKLAQNKSSIFISVHQLPKNSLIHFISATPSALETKSSVILQLKFSFFSVTRVRAFWREFQSEYPFGATNVPEHRFGEHQFQRTLSREVFYRHIRFLFDPGGQYLLYQKQAFIWRRCKGDMADSSLFPAALTNWNTPGVPTKRVLGEINFDSPILSN